MHPSGSARITRRKALLACAGLTAALGLSGLSSIVDSAAAQPLQPASRGDASGDVDIAGRRLPNPASSGIEHIVVVMMENRSFDHFLGWLPGADGRQAGLKYTDRAGAVHRTYRLAPIFQGCQFADPDHSFAGGRVEYDGGKCDGWLRAGDNDDFCIGFYTPSDLAFFSKIAPRFATCDRYFPAIMGPTFPNRIFQHAAQTDRLSNTAARSTLPTIWDSLAAAGISGRYYYSDIPATALWGTRYLGISQPVATFFADAAAGTLPAVSYVDPGFAGEATGTSNDDHPWNDIRNGQVFLDSIYRAITTGPDWRNTVFVINYDEWGGFFDHVPPPAGAVTPREQALGYTDGLRGFRVPCLVISPWSQHGKVPSTVFDHTSVLKMIEWRFGLQPLSVRDAQANNLATVLDFQRPRYEAPQPNVPPGPYGSACPPATPSATAQPAAAAAVEPTVNPTDNDAGLRFEWLAVRDLSRKNGWRI
jgi:phospholipase C